MPSKNESIKSDQKCVYTVQKMVILVKLDVKATIYRYIQELASVLGPSVRKNLPQISNLLCDLNAGFYPLKKYCF